MCITQAAGGITNTNIIITAELIAARAQPRIITAFHLTWPGTLLKCIFILNYLFVRGEEKWRQKMERIWRKILELKSHWSLTVRSHSFSAWGHRGCTEHCWSLQRSQVPVNAKLHISSALWRLCPGWWRGRVTVHCFRLCHSGFYLEEHFIARWNSAVGEERSKTKQHNHIINILRFKIF